MSTVAKSLFDITTGRNHGVIPTSDAVRIILESGATIMLDKAPPAPGGTDGDAIQARAAWGETGRAPRVDVTHHQPDDDQLNRSFSRVISVTADRVDRALSALVGKLLVGDEGVEVTEWTVPKSPGRGKCVRFGNIGVPLFIKSHDNDITKLLLSAVEMARSNDKRGLIYAIVVRVAGNSNLAGIACGPEKPEPPLGATLVTRRRIGGKPRIDVPWDQVEDEGPPIVLRAIKQLKIDCEMMGIDYADLLPNLCLVSDSGQEKVGPEITWNIRAKALAEIIDDELPKLFWNPRGVVNIATLRVMARQR